MPVLLRFLFLILFAAGPWVLSQSKSPSKAGKAQPVPPVAAIVKLYAELLAFHQKEAAISRKYKQSPFGSVSTDLISRLSSEQLGAHYRSHVAEFVAESELLEKKVRILNLVESRIRELPLTNSYERPKLEKDQVGLAREVQRLKESMVRRSLLANEMIRASLKTLTEEQKTAVAVAAESKEKPKMPGVYGGSVAERERQKAEERFFLTPVDAQFYDSQLGKKVERDLGRAQYWSYDFDKDFLFIRNQSGLGKVFVEDNGSGRFIKTRTGPEFRELISADEKVQSGAQGRFLTGSRDEETLFGETPKESGPKTVDERKLLPPGHHHGDGHDHDH